MKQFQPLKCRGPFINKPYRETRAWGKGNRSYVVGGLLDASLAMFPQYFARTRPGELTCGGDSLFMRSRTGYWQGRHRPGGRVAMQRTANPCTSVRFRPGPPNVVFHIGGTYKGGESSLLSCRVAAEGEGTLGG